MNPLENFRLSFALAAAEVMLSSSRSTLSGRSWNDGKHDVVKFLSSFDLGSLQASLASLDWLEHNLLTVDGYTTQEHTRVNEVLHDIIMKRIKMRITEKL